MDKGRLIDYASPYELLNDRQTILFDLVNNLDRGETLKLVELAHEAYLKRGNSPLQKVPEEFFEVPLSDGEEEVPSVLFRSEEKEAFLMLNRKC